MGRESRANHNGKIGIQPVREKQGRLNAASTTIEGVNGFRGLVTENVIPPLRGKNGNQMLRIPT